MQLNRLRDYVGKIVIPDDEVPVVIGNDRAMDRVQQGQERQDEQAEANFNGQIAYVEMISHPNDYTKRILGNVRAAEAKDNAIVGAVLGKLEATADNDFDVDDPEVPMA